jgi:hypothetical protein
VPPVTSNKTDWTLCFLCQELKKQHKLICPAKAKTKTCGYDYIADMLLDFQALGQSPINIDLQRLDDGNGIANTLSNHKAEYHKVCYMKFSKDKLERAKRSKRAQSPEASAISPKKLRSSTGHLSSSVDDKEAPEMNKCFFCDKIGSTRLHRASTMDLDERVRQCARQICDTKLLAKLASGDMHWMHITTLIA